MNIVVVVLVAIAAFLKMSVYIFQEYERGVVFTLGHLTGVKGPGIKFIVPFMQRVVRIDQRTITMDVPPQDIITRDNVSVKVNAVIYYRVNEPDKAVNQVENYHYATSQLAQTTLRSICGQAELDELLSNRDELNAKIQDILDRHTDPWGIKVSLVEIKHIDLPQEMQRAMAKQAEAERERRGKIIQAEGEYQAAERLKDAAAILGQESGALQLRYLETLKSISVENNSTILFPMPIDLLKAFGGK